MLRFGQDLGRLRSGLLRLFFSLYSSVTRNMIFLWCHLGLLYIKRVSLPVPVPVVKPFYFSSSHLMVHYTYRFLVLYSMSEVYCSVH